MAKKAKKARKARSPKANDKKLKEQATRQLSKKPVERVKTSAADHRQVRGVAGVPAAGKSKVIEVTYAPPDGEAQLTTVDGIPFRAYEPVAIPVDRQNTIQTLSQNPHFTVGKPNKKSKDYQTWLLRQKHDHERTIMQERHNKEMTKLRGAGYTADGDLLPAGTNQNPPRTS